MRGPCRSMRPRKLVAAAVAAVAAVGGSQCFVPLTPRATVSPRTPLLRASSTVPVAKDLSSDFVGKPGRAGGGGGGGPTPEEQAQVVIYRVALAVAAVCWTLIYTLDFFMTNLHGGISIIDGSIQSSALALADVSAALAMLAVPLGSRLAAGLVFRLLGLGTLLLIALGQAQGLGAVPGPLCVVLLCAREIFWFGWFYKVDAIWGVLCFVLVCAWRLRMASESTSEVLAPELPAFESWEDMPKFPMLYDVKPVGPPVPLSFGCWISLSVLALGKLFEPLGEDLDELGERWSKRSSRPLYDDEGPEESGPDESGTQ